MKNKQHCTTGFVAMLLMAVGAINWGLVGALEYNLVESLFGAGTTLTGVIYVAVGLSGIWGLTLLSGKGCCGGKCKMGKK